MRKYLFLSLALLVFILLFNNYSSKHADAQLASSIEEMNDQIRFIESNLSEKDKQMKILQDEIKKKNHTIDYLLLQLKSTMVQGQPKRMQTIPWNFKSNHNVATEI